MNIFYLDPLPRTCAQMHCDKHVVKMIVETAQMLSTAHRFLSPASYCEDNNLYQVSFQHHPSTKWCMKTTGNYLWLARLFDELNTEYWFRFGSKHEPPRMHKASSMSQALGRAPLRIPEGPFSAPPQCMPDIYKGPDAVDAYQRYYLGAKARFAKWAHGPTPEWWMEAQDAQA